VADSAPRPRFGPCVELAVALTETYDLAFLVPGAPITHLCDVLAGMHSNPEWAINEKYAVESAVGATLAGLASCVILKHNGLAIALDTLANAAVHTIAAPLIVVSGDDPSAVSSTNVVDSRELAAAIGVPCIEPPTQATCGHAVRVASRISADHSVPVIVRITTALHEACVLGADCQPVVVRAHKGATRQADDTNRFVAHRLTKLGRIQYRRTATIPGVERSLERQLETVKHRSSCRVGIIRVGSAASDISNHGCCEYSTGVAWPVPERLVAFARRHERIVVLEDSAPFVELRVNAQLGSEHAVCGRISGHLPPEGGLASDDIRAVICGGQRVWSEVQQKGQQPAVAEPLHKMFQAVAAARRAGIFVATDVGSSVGICYPPYSGADAALALGASVAIAGGAARKGSPAVAIVGDYAFLHSGIPSTIEAVSHGLAIVIVVLVNGAQVKTGGQPVHDINLARLAESCGVLKVEQWGLDELDETECSVRLDYLLRLGGPVVVLARYSHISADRQDASAIGYERHSLREESRRAALSRVRSVSGGVGTSSADALRRRTV
jgi:indolepyruvate ferredoxin oxidoreductase, alpha subunit